MTCKGHRITLSPKGRLVFHDHDKSLWLEEDLRVLAGLEPACECAAELRRWRDPIERCQTPELQKVKAAQTRLYVDADGRKAWWRNGKPHRDDGPAVIHANGYKAWWRNGAWHRDDGPAIIGANGYKAWWRNDKLHRDDGPAVIYADGSKEWWRNGKRQGIS